MNGKSAIILLAIVAAVAAHEYATECPLEQEDDWRIEHLLRHEDCEKFYKCTHGQPIVYVCAAGLHFNLATWQCDWIHNVDCEGRNVPEVEKEESKEEKPVHESSEEPEWVSVEESESKEHKESSEEPASSESKESPVVVESVETEEEKHESTEEEKHESTEEETHESTEEEKHESTEKEKHESTEEETRESTEEEKHESTEEEKHESSEETDDGGAVGPELSENGCPSDHHIHWLLPHECDCGKFYYCVWGELALRRCPAGLHFNPVLQVCDWPANAGCAASTNKHLEGRQAMLKFLS